MKAGKQIEIRSVDGLPVANIEKGQSIVISKILRSHSVDGLIQKIQSRLFGQNDEKRCI